MATKVQPNSISKVLGETVSLTTTAYHLNFYPKYHEVKFYCASDWRMGIAPKLLDVVYYNGTTYTHYPTQGIDRSTATHVPLDGMTTAHKLYLRVSDPTRGFHFTIDGTNKNAETATLDFEYCSAISSGVGTFTDVASDSDGTDTGGATLNTSGLYSFTLPSVDYGALTDIGGPGYWYRFTPSATLSTTVDIQQIVPACDTTSYGYMQGGQEYQFSINQSEQGAFEFDHTATDTLNVTWIRH